MAGSEDRNYIGALVDQMIAQVQYPQPTWQPEQPRLPMQGPVQGIFDIEGGDAGGTFNDAPWIEPAYEPPPSYVGGSDKDEYRGTPSPAPYVPPPVQAPVQSPLYTGGNDNGPGTSAPAQAPYVPPTPALAPFVPWSGPSTYQGPNWQGGTGPVGGSSPIQSIGLFAPGTFTDTTDRGQNSVAPAPAPFLPTAQDTTAPFSGGDDAAPFTAPSSPGYGFDTGQDQNGGVFGGGQNGGGTISTPQPTWTPEPERNDQPTFPQPTWPQETPRMDQNGAPLTGGQNDPLPPLDRGPGTATTTPGQNGGQNGTGTTTPPATTPPVTTPPAGRAPRNDWINPATGDYQRLDSNNWVEGEVWTQYDAERDGPIYMWGDPENPYRSYMEIFGTDQNGNPTTATGRIPPTTPPTGPQRPATEWPTNPEDLPPGQNPPDYGVPDDYVPYIPPGTPGTPGNPTPPTAEALRNEALGRGRTGVQSYFQGRGLDYNPYNDPIEARLAEIMAGIPGDDVTDLDEYFMGSGENIWNTLEGQARTSALSEYDQLFGSGYTSGAIGDTADDAFIESILGEQRMGADELISNSLARGTITQTGYDKARGEIDRRAGQARNRLNEYGTSALATGRGSLGSLISTNRSQAANRGLGDSYSIAAPRQSAENLVNSFIASLGDTIRGKVTSPLISTTGLQSLARSAGGNFGAIGGTSLEEEENRLRRANF